MPCSAVLRLEEEIELFEADLEAMGCGEGRAKVCSLSTGVWTPPKLPEADLTQRRRLRHTYATNHLRHDSVRRQNSSMVLPCLGAES